MAQNISNAGLGRLWWVPLVTGLICIGLGIWTFACPAESIMVLAYVFSVCLVIAGAFNMGYTLLAFGMPNRWWSCALGLLEILAGVWLLVMPQAQMMASFIFIVGVWIIISAINSICEAGFLASYSAGWLVWMILLLIATVVLAIIFLSGPVAGGVAVWLWMGFSFICFGFFRLCLAFMLRGVEKVRENI